ncbi:MAG TPA: PASTA domain-containing protein [Bacteroidales bacterium]|nr:PASTA domain-containing protein [Bacteroidales bacterium]
MMKKFFRFLSSKLFLINFGIAIVFFALCFLVLNLFLKSYTRHGDSVTVPNLIGMQTEDAIALIEESDFNYVIVDTVFDNKYDKGAIVEQNPIPESLVKEGRKIYLKVNSNQDEMISMPQLTGFTLRQVTSMMETYGLVIGNLRYIPDIAVNVVIKQIYKGKEIEPGEKIKKGSSIDLILGLGISDKTTTVPSLIGMTYREASNALLDLFLNTGAVNYDNTVKTKNDSLKAKVYRQSPQYSTINEVNLGYNVDIWLTKDESLLNASQNQADDEIENDND